MLRCQRVIDEQLNGQAMPEEPFATELLVTGVSSQRSHRLSSDRLCTDLRMTKPRHQPGRQRRSARIVVIDCAEPVFQEAPVVWSLSRRSLGRIARSPPCFVATVETRVQFAE